MFFSYLNQIKRTSNFCSSKRSHRNNNKIVQEIVKKVLSPDLHVLALVTLCYAININVIFNAIIKLAKVCWIYRSLLIRKKL